MDTEYVFISRGVVQFTNSTRLETLLDTLTKTVAVVVSSSTRRPDTGQVLNISGLRITILLAFIYLIVKSQKLV